MLRDILAAEGRKFCQTTSVRGVPKIINSKSTLLSVVWFFGVLTCACVIIWQLSVIFRRYTSYPVNTVFVQSPEWDNTTFPDITICNLCPLVYDSEKSLIYSDYILKFHDQFEKIENNMKSVILSSNVNKSGEALDEYVESIYQHFVSPAAYFLNFEIKKNLTDIDKKSPIIDCSYFNWDFNENDNKKCIDEIQQIWDPDFYKCYTLRVADSERKNVRGFSTIVYVDDFLDSLWMNYNLDLRSTRAKGLQVLIHAPGTQPNMKLGLSVGTGTSTTIALDQTKLTRLPEPYSNCTDRKTLGEIDDKTSYTKAYCIDVCLQKQYLKECGCVLSTLQFTDSQLKEANNSVCGNLGIVSKDSTFSTKGLTQMLCAKNYDEDQSACYNECPISCHEYKYSTSISAAPWPHRSAQFSLYSSQISGSFPSGSIFHKYDSLSLIANTDKVKAREILDTLDRERIISDKFLQLNIQFNNPSYNHQKDVGAFPLDAFGAQVGGMLSLWLGLTITVSIELCELIINLVTAVYKAKRSQPASGGDVAESKS